MSLVSILTPQGGKNTQLRKHFDGGWGITINTSDFPYAMNSAEDPIRSIMSQLYELICDVEGHPISDSSGIDAHPTSDSSPGDARQSTKGDGAVTQVVSNSDSDSDSDSGVAQATVADGRPHDIGDNAALNVKSSVAQAHLRQGYDVVSKELNEWKVTLERVDSEGLMRDTPSCFRYQYRLKNSKDLSRASRADFLDAIKYKLALDEGANIAVNISRGFLVFEISKNSDDRYAVWADELWSKVDGMYDGIDRLAVAVGESISTGEPVIIDFKKLPHLLIAGQTGAGKSVAIETIIEGLTRFYPPEMFELSIVDLKGVDFLKYRNSPHLTTEIAGKPQEALLLLRGLVKTTDERMTLFRDNGVKNISEYNVKRAESPLPYKMVVIDEFAELVLNDPAMKKNIIQLVQSIAQKSRAAGTHLVVCTQYPRGDVVDRLITANLPGRLCLKVPDSTASGLVLNSSGADKLALDGDALYVDGTSGMERLQIAMVRD